MFYRTNIKSRIYETALSVIHILFHIHILLDIFRGTEYS